MDHHVYVRVVGHSSVSRKFSIHDHTEVRMIHREEAVVQNIMELVVIINNNEDLSSAFNLSFVGTYGDYESNVFVSPTNSRGKRTQ